MTDWSVIVNTLQPGLFHNDVTVGILSKRVFAISRRHAPEVC